MKKTEAKILKTQKGVVVSISGQSTIKVEIKQKIQHKILKKLYTTSRRFLVHDPESKAQVGDSVMIIPGKRISKNKSWHIAE